MNLQISGGVDSLTLIDEHGNTVCTFANCDEETRWVAWKIVTAFNRAEAQCRWVYDEGMDFYDSDCGETYTFVAGSASDNNVNYCHGCGKHVKTIYPRPEDA